MIYKGFLLATAGGMAMVPGAQAADMQLKAPVMAAPVASWTGWYIGAHAGVNWQQASSITTYDTTSANVAHTDGSGFIGGGQIGYNFQHGNSVFGIEGDFSWLGGGGSWASAPVPGKISAHVSNKVDWLSTVRGRMGLAIGDTMVYATGGIAIGHANNSQTPFEGTPPWPVTKSESKTKVGWVVGGGIEHMWDQHWSIGLEGLFVDLGKSTATSVSPAGFSKSTTFTNQIVIGRAKLNYKF